MLRDFLGQIHRKISWFRGSLQSKLHQKAIGKKQPILWLFSSQISLEINRFCADQTSVFNIFLTEVIILLFQQQYAPQINQWHNLRSGPILAVLIHFSLTATAKIGLFSFRLARRNVIFKAKQK